MKNEDSHLSDQTLLLHIDGELSGRDVRLASEHLEGCWRCRTRRSELERAIEGFVRSNHERFAEQAPPADGPRARLRARMEELAAQAGSHSIAQLFWLRAGRWAAGAVLLLAVGLAGLHIETVRRQKIARDEALELPDARLTPGAAILASRVAICSAPDAKNKTVPVALRKRVFDEYGISGADPSAYEVDYLVTPALGGADDIRNLWPHSYRSTKWNALVKDQLEDHLRDLVCGGRLDLAAAQQEIAADWIAAYKKYFHTESPLDRYCRRCTP